MSGWKGDVSREISKAKECKNRERLEKVADVNQVIRTDVTKMSPVENSLVAIEVFSLLL